MTFEYLQEALDFAKGLHKINKNRINFSINDRKHAIYILQGGILTACSNALKHNLEGSYMSTALHKRLIDETVNLIWYFDADLTDDSRHIRAWFRGEVVERKTGKGAELSVKQRAKASNSESELIENLDNIFKILNQHTSKYMHPTINIMRANLSKKTNYYDYGYYLVKKPALSASDFGSFYITPTLNSLRIPEKTLSLFEADWIKLKDYVKKIENH